MILLVPRILSWSRRRRVLVTVGLICLAALAATGARRLTFDTDVLALLPRDGRVIPAFRSFVEHFGSLDDLYIVFTAPEGHSISEYDAEIDAWVEHLRRTPDITRVDTGTADPARDLGWLADRQLLLLSDDRLAEAVRRLKGDGMPAALAARRELLALPSREIADLVRQDPLGLFDLLGEELGASKAGFGLGITAGGYVTPDSRSRLVIARPAAPPFDTAFSHALLQKVESGRVAAAKARAEAATEELPPPLHVEVAGGHRIAVETESVVRRESILNTAGSLALILPLLFIVFRSLWLVVVGPLPSALALVVVLGALGLAGATLSAAATASAAMLFGLGVDGVVLLYVTHTLARGHGADGAGDPLAGAASSMLLGMWTTAATFYGLLFVDFPSLQQLGGLIGHSMVLCGIFTLLLVPALLPARALRRPARRLTMPRFAGWVDRRRTAILVAACFATLALGAAAFTIRIDPTLDRLRSVTPGAVALDEIGRRFELPHDVYAVVQRGPALEPLLGADERIRAGVQQMQPSLGMMSASSLLPSTGMQATRARTIEAAGLSPAGVSAELGSAADAAGFTRESMHPFLERLPRLLANAQALTFESYVDHGLGDLIGRFVAKTSDGWLLASYAFPATNEEVAALQRIVTTAGGSATLTGLPLVNRELADRFVPQFLKGLAIGSIIVIALILIALRNWRLSAMALAPAALGLVWAAGILAIAGIELDLFAVFAVVTFVGIGVDYGIHLVHRYRERGHAARAVEELAPVILVAAAITLLGYGTLVTSSYPPLRSIGVVSVVTVLTLAAASLLVLPALLPRSPAPVSRAPLESQPGATS